MTKGKPNHVAECRRCSVVVAVIPLLRNSPHCCPECGQAMGKRVAADAGEYRRAHGKLKSVMAALLAVGCE